MRRLTLIAMFFAAVAQAEKIQGGISSNGGGGLHPQRTEFTPIGPVGEFFEQVTEAPYEEIVSNFAAKNPQVEIKKCGGLFQKGSYPVLPANLRSSFVFKARWRDLFGEHVQPLFHERLCGHRDILEAYGRLSMALHQISSKDESGLYLVKKVVEKGGPVEVVVTGDPLVVNEITEYTWFNQTTGQLFWAFRKNPAKGGRFLLGRSPWSFVRHEMAHVLLARSLGERYPKMRQWHASGSGDVIDLVTKLRTSKEAAFVEGLAYALEAGTVGMHPYITSTGNFLQVFQNEKTGRACYWGWEKFVNEQGKLQGLEDGEVFTASTLSDLVEGWEFNDVSTKGTLGGEAPGVYNTFDPARFQALVDAVTDEAPTNLDELARAYDKVRKSDDGRAWLREFFFRDYVTGQGTEANLERVDLTRDNGQVDHLLCAKVGTEKDYYSPREVLLQNEAVEAAKRHHAAQVKSSSLLKDLEEVSEASTQAKVSADKVISAAEGEALQEKFRKRLGPCEDRNAVFSKITDSEFGYKLQREIQNKRGRVIPLVTLFEHIQGGCDRNDRFALGQERKLVDDAPGQIKDFLSKTDVSAALESDRHFQDVQTWLGLRGKITSAIDHYLDGIAIVAYLRDQGL